MSDAPSLRESLTVIDGLDFVAEVIGWSVLLGVALLAVTVVAVMIVRHFPLRFDARKPYDAYITTRYGSYPITWWIAVSTRDGGKAGWMFGLHLYGKLGEEARGPRVISRKDGSSQQIPPSNG